MRQCLNEFELELNNTKTKISPTGPFFPDAWKEYIRSILPHSTVDRSLILQYFYGIETTAKAHPEANVQKFSIQNARRLFLQTNEWDLVEDYLLSSYRQNPTVISVVTEILILRQLEMKDVRINRVVSFVMARLGTLIKLRKNGEICWLLFLCICLGAKLRASLISELFALEDGAIAVLVADASKQGIIDGSIDYSVWDTSLTKEGLRSSMWIYAYESAIKGLNPTRTDSHVVSDDYFGPLASHNVEFYRSGSFHLNKNQLLSQLRLERLRMLLQKRALENDLAEDFDDFDEVEIEHQDEEVDFY